MRATPSLSATHYLGTQEFRIFSNSMEAFVGEGLFQPMHLLVIFLIALLVFDRESRPSSAADSATASAN
jgi:hypothetical protein